MKVMGYSQVSTYIQKLMDRFLLFTIGPLLLSVKGIIDLTQMPPTILLPHPGGTGTPTLERAYLSGAQPPFPPRPFNSTSISPGEDPSQSYTLFFPYLYCHQLCVPPHTLGASLDGAERFRVTAVTAGIGLICNFQDVLIECLDFDRKFWKTSIQ